VDGWDQSSNVLNARNVCRPPTAAGISTHHAGDIGVMHNVREHVDHVLVECMAGPIALWILMSATTSCQRDDSPKPPNEKQSKTTN